MKNIEGFGAALFGVGMAVAGSYFAPWAYGFSPREMHQTNKKFINIPPIDIWPTLFVVAKELREIWVPGLSVTSWYRSPEVNSAVGGVANSKHLVGRGVDVVGPAVAMETIYGKAVNSPKWSAVDEGGHIHLSYKGKV